MLSVAIGREESEQFVLELEMITDTTFCFAGDIPGGNNGDSDGPYTGWKFHTHLGNHVSQEGAKKAS